MKTASAFRRGGFALFATVLSVASWTRPASADTITNVWEDFVAFTATNSSTDISSSLDTYTRVSGWTGSRVYQNGDHAKLGASSALGYITTPAMDLSGYGGQATLKFDAFRWSVSDGTVIKVFLDGLQVSTNIPLTDAWLTYELPLTGGTTTSKVQIAASVSSQERFFLDNIYITQDTGGADLPNVIISGPPAMVEFAVTNVTLSGTATANVEGQIAWTNLLNAANGAVAAAVNWTIPDIPLAVGTNRIVVRGTNALGQASAPTATVIRVAADYLPPPPLLAPTGVNYDTFTVNWTSVINATGYEVDVASNAEFNSGAILYRETFDTAGWNGWTTSSLAGTKTWMPSTGNSYLGTTNVYMNGYDTGGETNEVWLISPALNLSASTQPALSFMSAQNFTGPALEVKVSTNYVDGLPANDPSVTWHPLTAAFGPVNYIWTSSGPLDLTAFKGANVHVAFRYVSYGLSGSAIAIRLDEIQVRDVAQPGPSDFVPGYRLVDVGNATSLVVSNLAEEIRYYYRVRAYNDVADGPYSAVSNVLTVGTDQPVLAFTGVPVSVPYELTDVTVRGTANSNVTGWLEWTNGLAGTGFLEATSNWTIASVPLLQGLNTLTVAGTNARGRVALISTNIVRRAPLLAGTMIEEGFDNGSQPLPGWAYTNIGSYSTAANAGLSIPSLSFNSAGSSVTTPAFANGTNVSFFIKGLPSGGTMSTGVFNVLQFDGSSWSVLASYTNIPNTAATTTLGISTNIVQLRFEWLKESGNVAFDDLVVTGLGPYVPPVSFALTGMRFEAGFLVLQWTGATGPVTVSSSTNLLHGFAPLVDNINADSVWLDASGFGTNQFFRAEQ